MSKPYEIAPPIADQLMRDIYELAVRSEARGGDCFDLMCLMDQAGGVDAGIRKLIDMVRARDGQKYFHKGRADRLEKSHDLLKELIGLVTGPLRDPVLTPMAVKAVCDKAVAHIAALEGPSPLDRAYADAVEVVTNLGEQGIEVKE